MLNNAKVMRQVATVTIIANVLLLVLKLVISLIFQNFTVFADAVHSAADVMTSLVIILVSFFISAKPDAKYNYGRERVEALFTLILSFAVAAVSVYLAWEGIEGIINPEVTNKGDYLYLILTVVASLLVKEGLFWYGWHQAKKIKSEMLRMTAWHNRSDSLSSVAVLIGLVCSTFVKTNIFENIAVIIVALLIIKVAIEIFVTAMRQLVDRAADPKVCARIKELTAAVKGVQEVVDLRTRLFGNRVNLDLVLAVEAKTTLEQAVALKNSVREKLLAAEELAIKSCTIELQPAK